MKVSLLGVADDPTKWFSSHLLLEVPRWFHLWLELKKEGGKARRVSTALLKIRQSSKEFHWGLLIPSLLLFRINLASVHLSFG